MSEAMLTALLAVLGVLGAAMFGTVGVMLGLVWRRLVNLEAVNNGLWAYNRSLIDAFYTAVKRPPPPPPSHIAHLFDTGQ